MKECKYCRTMYADNLSVCPKCGGNKIVTAEERAEELALKQKEKENRENAIAEPLKMRRNILIGLGTVVGLLLLIMVITSINANKPYSDGTTKDQAAELLDTGKEYFDKGEYEAAIECFAQLPTDSKEYEEAQTLIEKSAESYRKNIISKVDTYVQKEEYEVGIGMLEKALKVLPSDIALKEKYNAIKDLHRKDVISNALSEAKEYAGKSDYPNAIRTLQDAITKIGADEEIAAQMDTYKNTYASSVIDAAKKQYIEYNAQSIYAAEDIIESALKIVPDNQALKDEYNFYKEHEPVNVIQLLTSNDDNDFILKEAVKDTTGKVYSSALCGAAYDYVTKDDFGDIWAWQWCYEYIELDYQYSKFTGVFFHNEAYKTAPVETFFIIDGDHLGDTLWMGKVSKNSGVKSFSVDVSQEPNIRIEFSIPNDFISERDPEILEYACIAELYLWR